MQLCNFTDFVCVVDLFPFATISICPHRFTIRLRRACENRKMIIIVGWKWNKQTPPFMLAEKYISTFVTEFEFIE